MKQSGNFFPGWPADGGDLRKNTEWTGTFTTLTVLDTHPHKERGYNPYDTTAHAMDTRRKDVWRHRSKRG
jgi:hypothetical protein